MTRLLPITMMILSALAGVVYACNRDLRHSVYWFAAAILNASVTF